MKRAVYVLGCTVVAALGGFLFGFDTIVISGAEQAVQDRFNVPAWIQGLTVSSALVGTMVGALLVGRPCDWLGRRAMLGVLALLFFVSAAGSALAWGWWSFMFFRFVGGLGVGGAAVVSPMYVSEIAPVRYRGRLVAVTQLNIVIGILAAFLSNYLIGTVWNPEALGVWWAVEWRWMLGVEVIPAVVFGLLLLPAPESPRWLVAEGRSAEARSLLAKLGTDTGDVEADLREIERSLASRHGISERFFQRKYLGPILLAVAIAAFNQLSGINAVLYYATRIFEMAGAGENAALLQGVVIGCVNLVMTVAAMTVIDRFGRRTLMLAGSVAYIVGLAGIAGAFFYYGDDFSSAGAGLLLGALMVFIAGHAFGQGAVIWVFISEIFPNAVRARGQSLGVFTHWFMAFVTSSLFPLIAERSGGLPFAFFAGMMALQLLWVVFIMPETEGVPLERIHEKLGIRNGAGDRP